MTDATAHSHDHHELPVAGRALDAVALSATLHCLTGCAIGEVLGMIIGTLLGFSNLGTILLAVALAFLFGYTLTSLPLLRAGLALGAVIPIALASDTLSIATMEVVDNVIMLTVPGALEAGVGDELFWGALSVALVVAGAFAFPVNRWLIARGKGHVAVHRQASTAAPRPSWWARSRQGQQSSGRSSCSRSELRIPQPPWSRVRETGLEPLQPLAHVAQLGQDVRLEGPQTSSFERR